MYNNYPGQLPVLYTIRHHCSRCRTFKPISETVDLLNVAYLGQWTDNWGKKPFYVSVGIYPAYLTQLDKCQLHLL